MHYISIAPPGAAPAELSQLALAALQHHLSPDVLDMMARAFTETARELRASGLSREVGNA